MTYSYNLENSYNLQSSRSVATIMQRYRLIEQYQMIRIEARNTDRHEAIKRSYHLLPRLPVIPPSRRLKLIQPRQYYRNTLLRSTARRLVSLYSSRSRLFGILEPITSNGSGQSWQFKGELSLLDILRRADVAIKSTALAARST